jgi:hypothetical protein
VVAAIGDASTVTGSPVTAIGSRRGAAADDGGAEGGAGGAGRMALGSGGSANDAPADGGKGGQVAPSSANHAAVFGAIGQQNSGTNKLLSTRPDVHLYGLRRTRSVDASGGGSSRTGALVGSRDIGDDILKLVSAEQLRASIASHGTPPERAHHLSVYDIASAATLGALTAPTFRLYPGAGYRHTVGVRGMRGRRGVVASSGFSQGLRDGRSGFSTGGRVKLLQLAHGPPSVGIVGVHSWRAWLAAGGHFGASRRHPEFPSDLAAKAGQLLRHVLGLLAPKAGQPLRHVLGLPVTLLLLGLALLGLATMLLSYTRTHARARRAGAGGG